MCIQGSSDVSIHDEAAYPNTEKGTGMFGRGASGPLTSVCATSCGTSRNVNGLCKSSVISSLIKFSQLHCGFRRLHHHGTGPRDDVDGCTVRVLGARRRMSKLMVTISETIHCKGIPNDRQWREAPDYGIRAEVGRLAQSL